MVKKVLVLGSGGLSIGQAGEFDYSGSQAMKALKEEGMKTVLVNPNIATIQTSEGMADRIYFLPVTADFVEEIIEKEKPDGILLSFGGQTALNCGVELFRKGVLKKHGVKVLGTPVESIMMTEDRDLFAKKLEEIDVKIPESLAVDNIKDALKAAKTIGYPVILRAAYALGGLGSGFARDAEELSELASKALSSSKQVLIEDSLKGWKEVEYEVVRDSADNCITVCNMENFDPLGIHTGESIVIAPSQTLTNSEYHKLREISIKVIRHLGVVGECNIQFALDPESEDYRVIEVNARLSRSSALASKATGYPLAAVACKLALGKTLPEIKNAVTKKTCACFEPSLDYVVVKYPRWDFEKFSKVSRRLGSSMKSVGEVMSIGRTFEEAFQKALRMIGNGYPGFACSNHAFKSIEGELQKPSDKRVLALRQALLKGMSVDKLYELTKIDKWFLYKLQRIVDIEKRLKKSLSKDLLLEAKKAGFSDEQVGICVGKSEAEIRALRKKHKISPFVKQIDTMAAEFPAQTNYLYLTYNATKDDIEKESKKSVIILGSGAYRIGSSVEFDWCCVTCALTLNKLGYKTIMVNHNPETVSTDYDVCDKLYFDELSLESVLDIFEKERSLGVVVSMGGQIPNNLALKLRDNKVKVLGTTPKDIDNAEDRHKFSKLLDSLGIDQPPWKELTNIANAKRFADSVGYPVLVRPSYVLSGAAMNVAHDSEELEKYLGQASDVSNEHPVIISKFITGAKEIEMDAVAKNGEIVCYAISEHIENAGVHSGDATLVFPAQNLYLETIRKIKKSTRAIAKKLNITGPFNIQYLAKENEIKVIECNLRASRSFPFVSKVLKLNLIDIASKAIMGEKIPEINKSSFELDYVGIKAPQFSFTRLHGADPQLGVEMASTGEVACLGEDIHDAFLKSLISSGFTMPKKRILLSTGPVKSKARFLDSAKKLEEMGYELYATPGTAKFLRSNEVRCKVLNWPLDDKQPNIKDYIREKKLDLVLNIPKSYKKEELTNGYIIRRSAVDHSIPLITNLKCAILLVDSLERARTLPFEVKAWEDYT
ncbi:carbamoyl-phosphate synthase (glutamine-hydrolyzing) large subunit [Nanoarchaeota archaeon]